MNDTYGRFLIASYALSAWDGHYLKGARGGIPGGPSVVGRSVELYEDSSWDHLSIHAARNSLQRCYGRWAAFDDVGYLFKPQSTKLKQLKAYCEEHKGEPPESWPHFETVGMTPRRLSASSDSTIALGEDCRGRRHFDCIGFIFWALNQVLPNNAWENHVIPDYEKGFKTKDKRAELQGLGPLGASDLQAGDIVTRLTTTPQHIGIGLAGGMVIHASMESKGVLIEPYSKGKWTGISRLTPESYASY